MWFIALIVLILLAERRRRPWGMYRGGPGFGWRGPGFWFGGPGFGWRCPPMHGPGRGFGPRGGFGPRW